MCKRPDIIGSLMATIFSLKKFWIFIFSVDSNGACSLHFYRILFLVALLHLNLSRLEGFFQLVGVAYAWV